MDDSKHEIEQVDNEHYLHRVASLKTARKRL
jgi:hypothetical protein